jgi:uncharacterized protein YndB with AHSA1/START domain
VKDDELVYRRVLRAPRDLVWRCLTEPAELTQFWGPAGMATPLDGIVVELYSGGRFETLMLGEQGSHRMVATFTEVVPPERLAWVESATGMHTTSTLDDLGDGWRVRHVIAHVTMPVRLTAEQFGAEMAAARGDFTTLSDTVATRDALLPVADLLGQLRSPRLHAWQPPSGGAAGALSHAVIHSLDVTIALQQPAVAPAPAVTAVLDQLTAAEGALFGVDLTGLRLEAADTDWTWGRGHLLRADSGSLVALLSGRALPGGRTLARG